MFSSGSDVSVNSNQNTAFTPQSAAAVSDETEKFEQTYPLNPDGRVSVSNVNGSIVVEAWDRNEVKVEATKIGDSKESLAETEIKVVSRPEYLSIEVECDQWKGNNGWRNNRKIEVQFHLFVPRNAVLNEIETVNGSVTVSNFTNITKISAVNGSVNAANLRGTADLSTVNGEVKADFDRLENGSRISLSTVNGKVSLVLPSDINATIKADSLNGAITNDFGLPVRKGEYVGRDLFGRIGSGNVQIKLNSVNGPLSVGRKNDGKSPNPATNLLPNKGTDDEDWDDEDTKEKAVVNTAKINREVARAVRQSQAETARAIRESQRAIAVAPQVTPKIKIKDLEKIKVEIDEKAIAASVQKGIEAQQAALANLNINWAVGAPVIEKKRNSFAVKGTPTVNIEALGCGVIVRGWDKSEVKYVVTSLSGRGRSPVDVEETQNNSEISLKVKSDVSGKKGRFFYNTLTPSVKVVPKDVENVNINEDQAVVEYKDGKTERYDLTNSTEKSAFEKKYGRITPPPPAPDIGFDFDLAYDGNRSVRIEVFVPRKSNLKITSDGEIRLDGVTGDIDLKGDDESINIRDSGGKLHVAATDGQIRVIGFKGEFDSVTEDADLYLEGDFVKFRSKAGDGTIMLTLPGDTDAKFKANTEIESDGVELEKEDDTTWRLGNGGTIFNFEVADGKVIVRNADVINTY